jgi:hypothetical protein
VILSLLVAPVRLSGVNSVMPRIRRSATSRFRSAALPGALIAVLAVFAVGIGAAQASKPGRGASQKRIAQSAAGRLLGAFRAPPGAQRATKDPGPQAFLGSSPQRPATPNLVDRHGFWRVPGTTDDALHWIQGHLPSRAHQVGGGFAGGVGRLSTFFVIYGLPAGNRAIASRRLLVAVANLHSGTAMRVDAQVIWLTTRPASERIPAGVRSVRIVAQRPGQPASAPQTVTDAAHVAHIVSLVDGLPAAQPGAYSCPADTGPLVDLGFISGGPNPRRLATAQADASGCGGVSLSINGRPQPALTGGPKLIGQLNALLGLSLG